MEVSSIKPLPGYVLVLPDDAITQTSTGIYLGDAAEKEKPQTGTVVAIGDDSAPVKPGESVIFKMWAGNSFTPPQHSEVKTKADKEYAFMNYEDIIATYDR